MARGRTSALRADLIPYAQHESQARKHAGQGRYAAAVEEYRAAYALRQSPALLFNIGVCYQRLENHAEAVGYYDQYSARARSRARRLSKELEALLYADEKRSAKTQHKKRRLWSDSVSFSVGSASRPNRQAGTLYVVAREVPQPQGPVTQTSPPNEGRLDWVGSDGDRESQLSPQQRNSDAPGQSTERPLYKKAWFWGVVGGE